MAGSGRSEADAVLAGHLAAGLPLALAAKKAGVSERTARRRLKAPAFRKLVDDLKAEAVGRAVSILGRTMSKAAVELARLLKSADERTRLQAAREVIGLGLKARQVEELERRVADLEAMLREEGGGGTDHPIDEARSDRGAAPGPMGGDPGRPAAGPG